MNEFWLWFWRPIAEALGAVALLAAIAVAVTAVWWTAKLLSWAIAIVKGEHRD